ncbi:GntR family transcriptional regulator [Clostridium botulinum]|uniref:GntR family transcriptional regulator n=1 Tax=Clostridium botulinum TaxID=1491 RepID=A0A9Q1ZAR8_CLOBO|nr:GntR family transcriptional regulator [Clostridium botulinum]AEB77159.1 transcriptional regulator, GntR family [Clostridium botulinum BKT015925]KEI00264.1 GntR family transcriptional regulator [Clostridium botulinum D str. 16868]KEI00427.1 GntR family transcriptional regulator [Clostridium botulinum C/D str. Sp77]KLU76872.1 GntR family transcriptional regulator [Clostridium botulinum V891]KOA72731.1 GntR family transcriptional regulator [Clostridium botulinum]
MNIKFDEKVPIYIQIMDIIKQNIILGKLKGGDKLTSVRELSAEFKVNPNTIQRAYKELEREGFAYTQRGMGTFIVDDERIIFNLKKDTAKDIMNNFINGMKHLGFDNKEIVELVLKNLEGGN